MKQKFIYLAILFFSLNIFSQTNEPIRQQKELVADLPLYNFFYLSKYLNDPNLRSEQKDAVYAQFLNLLGTKKLKDLISSEGDELKELRDIVNRVILQSPATYKFLSFLKEKKLTELDKDFKLTPKDKIVIQDIESISNEIDDLKIQQINLLKISNEDQKKISNKIQSFEADSILKITKKDSILFLKNKLMENKVHFEKIISKNEIAVKTKSILLSEKINKYSSEYFKNNPQYIFSTVSVQDAQKFYGQTDAGKTLQYTNNYVQSKTKKK